MKRRRQRSGLPLAAGLIAVIAGGLLVAAFVDGHGRAPSGTAPVADPGGTTAPTVIADAPATALPVTALPVTDHGEVTHLVDGDTLDVSIAGAPTRIRLLNIDTPETVKPDTPVECMGPEASARLAQLAPVGTTVGLAYDVERTDQYGRTLAMVITADGSNASEVLAREGLAVAVKYGANVAEYGAMVAAQNQARDARVGLFSGACG